MSKVDLSLDTQLDRTVLPLIAVGCDAAWHPVGTAFVITTFTPTTALLLTAAHNLKHLLRLDVASTTHASNTPKDFLPPPPKAIQLKRTRFYAGVEGPREFVLAEVMKCWYQNDTDIAVVLAVIPDGRPAQFTGRFALDFSPVAEGTTLAAMGYASMAAEFASPPDYERQDFRVRLKKSVAKRAGSVTGVHNRGIGIYRWPGFIVGCAFDSGMSGGPLVDVAGEVPIVRGVVCGDLSEDEQNQGTGSGAHAFGSTLWPALGTPLEFDVELRATSGEVVRAQRLVDLVHHKVLDDRGDSMCHFQCKELENGYTVAWI